MFGRDSATTVSNAGHYAASLLLPLLAVVASTGCDRGLQAQGGPRLLRGAESPSDKQRMMFKGRVYVPTRERAASGLAEKPVEAAVVYLVQGNAVQTRFPTEAVTVKATGGKFVPDLSVVVVGQELVVEAGDGRDHHFSIESLKEPKAGSVAPVDTRKLKKRFSSPGDCAVLSCSVHPTERGFITVVPNPVFARTAKDGAFAFGSIFPPGKYEFCAYHPRHGRAKVTVQVRDAEEPEPIVFRLPAPRQ